MASKKQKFFDRVVKEWAADRRRLAKHLDAKRPNKAVDNIAPEKPGKSAPNPKVSKGRAAFNRGRAADSLRDDSVPESELETDHMAYLSEPGWNGPGRSVRSPELQQQMQETWDIICGD